ncbi:MULTISPECIES: hypothetical protein [unclassified Ruegeria]|uniref:hypothetical protein n=1 Tax=unclassified Ruegeria TaxID=2625375 RepID=UPI0014882CE1|nr:MULTISPECIES: hypothetical protein [unclassified Ruegeria]
MKHLDLIVQTLTEQRKTATGDAELIFDTTWALRETFEADGTPLEDAVRIVARVLYDHTLLSFRTVDQRKPER